MPCFGIFFRCGLALRWLGELARLDERTATVRSRLRRTGDFVTTVRAAGQQHLRYDPTCSCHSFQAQADLDVEVTQLKSLGGSLKTPAELTSDG